MNRKITLTLVVAGMILIGVGIVIPLFSMGRPDDLFRYIYSAGAAMLLVGRLFSPYQGDDLRLKRLYRLESWAALFFCVAAFMFFYEPKTIRDGVAFTLAGAIIQIYTSIMIPLRTNKISKNTPE